MKNEKTETNEKQSVKLEPRLVTIGGRRFVFDPDVTMKQEELLVGPLNEIFEVLPKPKTVDDLDIIKFMEASRRILKDGKLRHTLSLLLVPEGKEFSENQAVETENFLGKLKMSEREDLESVIPDFFIFMDNSLGVTTTYSSLTKIVAEMKKKKKR